MTDHPDLAAEQAYIEFAYACLERSREDAWRLRELTEVGRGGTMQARYERDVFEEAMYQRLSQLDLHDAALVFGRIDRHGDAPEHHEHHNGDNGDNGQSASAGPDASGAGPAGRLAAASGPSGDVSSGGGVESF